MSRPSEETMERAAEALVAGTEGSDSFVRSVESWGGTLNEVAMHGLMPIAVSALILHEFYFSSQDNRAFRAGWVLFRIVGFGALLLGYDQVVGVLTGLVGGASAWPHTGDLISPLEYAIERQLDWLSLMTISNMGETLPPFLIWMGLFFIDCICGLFAFITLTLLVKIQALLLVIFIASGKTCLILSIMPGVDVAKPWAKALATVAAWGAMGSIVFGAVSDLTPAQLRSFANSTSVACHFAVWGFYILMGIFTLSIPKLVSALTSGAASMTPGVGAAIAGAYLGLRLGKTGVSASGRALLGRKRPGEAIEEMSGSGTGRGRYGGKVPRHGVASRNGRPASKRTKSPQARNDADGSEGAALRGTAAAGKRREGQAGGQEAEAGKGKAGDSKDQAHAPQGSVGAPNTVANPQGEALQKGRASSSKSRVAKPGGQDASTSAVRADAQAVKNSPDGRSERVQVASRGAKGRASSSSPRDLTSSKSSGGGGGSLVGKPSAPGRTQRISEKQGPQRDAPLQAATHSRKATANRRGLEPDAKAEAGSKGAPEASARVVAPAKNTQGAKKETPTTRVNPSRAEPKPQVDEKANRRGQKQDRSEP